ncbi:hypothetical protein AWC38_SpisGene21700 [Stylophora pistillata]|uniref:Uncharacterized protein n=1 Tax=Stylophora pistillata TaxID=50429 RepID=A0A2B4RCR1_STYPI|nr:hypothetical protein AWC38_SpisGene21700 [Stylophora pistillata]
MSQFQICPPLLLQLLAISVRPEDVPLCGFGSLVVIKILGGRFRSVLPSSLTHPGAFARKYIPAKGQDYASAAEKLKRLRLLGRKHGCYSCGRRWWTSYVGDHMPLNKLVRGGQQQRFYPHCTHCSNLPEAALSSLSRLRRIKTHGTSLRLYHLWLPLPLPMAVLRNYNDENCRSKEPDKCSVSKQVNEDSGSKEVNKGSGIADQNKDGCFHTILNVPKMK